MLGAALTTAATLQATRESALTRSMSWWSMTAMSPGRSRLVRFLVRRSRRTVPDTPGADSWARPRRRVPRRMTSMLSRTPRRPDVDAQSGSAGHTGCSTPPRHDTPDPRSSPDRYRTVSSVTAVTGGASAVSRAATVPGPRADEGPPEVVVRAVPDASGAAAPDADDDTPAENLPGTSPVAAPDAVATEAAAPPEDAAAPRGRRRLRGAGIRERRRQQTRARIVDAAAELFAERGFDAVSVVEIAQRAGVVEKTVFNHFPVKEGLVFEADPPMRAALLDAARTPRAGESVAAAAGSFVVAAVSQLGSPAAAEGMTEMARVIRGSRTLQARERDIIGMLTDTLAEQIVLETRAAAGELEPWLAANAVLGLYSALLELARDRVLTGAAGPQLSAELRARGERGLALLQFGLAGYAKRR